jgi:F-type H+-transporting ATPase subunit b
MIPALLLAGVCLLFSGASLGATRAPGWWSASAGRTGRRSPDARVLNVTAGGVSAASYTSAAPQGSEGETEPKHEGLYKVINFVLLVGALGYLLRKPLGDFFAGRSEAIRKSLEEGRRALETSEAQLRAIEEKLRGLEDEIARFKTESAKEMEAERERLRQAAAAEAERMLEFARAQIASATRAAKLELKTYAARQAVDVAEQAIRQRLDEAGRHHLVRRFVQEVDRKPN